MVRARRIFIAQKFFENCICASRTLKQKHERVTRIETLYETEAYNSLR